MKLFLKLNRVHLFILFFVFAFSGDFLQYTIVHYTKNSLMYLNLANGLAYVIVLCWQWSITKNINEKLSKKLKLDFSKFKKVFWCLIVSQIILLSVILLKNYSLFVDTRLIKNIFIILMLFSLICGIYCTIFTAKELKTFDNKEISHSYSDYYGYFWGIIAFPIGIWFIQPKINKIFHNS